MAMQIYLPIAEMSVPAETLVMLGVAVGFLSGVFGIGGGFLATPFLLFMGVPPTVAVGTQANQLIATSVTGVLGHWRRGNVDFHLGGVMLAGGFAGTLIGMMIFKLLEHLGQIDAFIALGYILLLGSIGMMMFYESAGAFFKRSKGFEDIQSAAENTFLKNLPYKRRFLKSRLYVSVFIPAGIGLMGGIMVSVLGIGGGFIIVPAMIYILGTPGALVPGTSLLQIIFISAFSCFLHAVLNGTVDIVLSLVMMAGGVAGAQAGVRLARRINGRRARIFLSLIILAVCARMIGLMFVEPDNFFTMGTRP